VGDVSAELCGGTHVENTGNIGLFKIISESSVSSGVRRIEAVTGAGVIDYMNNSEDLIKGTAAALKINNVSEIEQRATAVVAELKSKEKELEDIKVKLSSYKADELIKQAKSLGKVELIAAMIKNISSENLRTLCDSIKVQKSNIVVVLAGINPAGDAVSFTAACAPEAIKAGVHAGRLVKEIAVLAGGSGGGRPDSAMAGSKNPALVNDAITHVDEVVLKMLK
jgi:alanyl-tRNA synthetase